MCFLVKRLVKIDVSLKTRALFFFSNERQDVLELLFTVREQSLRWSKERFRAISSFAPQTKRIHEF